MKSETGSKQAGDYEMKALTLAEAYRTMRVEDTRVVEVRRVRVRMTKLDSGAMALTKSGADRLRRAGADVVWSSTCSGDGYWRLD